MAFILYLLTPGELPHLPSGAVRHGFKIEAETRHENPYGVFSN
jgi:hypothetical protein